MFAGYAILLSDWWLVITASYISPGFWAPTATVLSFIGANKNPCEAGLQHWQLNNDYNNISPLSNTKQLEAGGDR